MIGDGLHETLVDNAVEIGPNLKQQYYKTAQQSRRNEAAAQHLYFTAQDIACQDRQGNDKDLNECAPHLRRSERCHCYSINR